MGRPMALNLMKHGHQMGIYARRPQAAAALIAAGAASYKTPAELAAVCDVVFTMVTAASDFEQVVLGENGLIHGAAAGSVVVGMETISPVVARDVAQALAATNVDMLDAPVSGSSASAQEATLAVMVGGKPQVFARVKPLFDCLGKTILHMGDQGAGQVTKACCQLSLTVTLQGVAEALVLAQRCGADVARVREAMLGGFAASRVLEIFGKRMVERDFENGVDARLYHKDLGIVLDLARELGMAAPAAEVTMQQINALVGSGGGKSDFSRMIETLERMSKA